MDKGSLRFWQVMTPGIIVYILLIIAGRYGIPRLFEKYGMPTKAVVTVTHNPNTRNSVCYEYSVDGKVYEGGMSSRYVSVGDTVLVWYIPALPWLSNCHEAALFR